MIVELKKLDEIMPLAIEVGGINQWNGTLWSQQHNKEKSFKIGEIMFFNGFPRETNHIKENLNNDGLDLTWFNMLLTNSTLTLL